MVRWNQLGETSSLTNNNKPYYFLESEFKNNSDVNTNRIFTLFNKVIKAVEDLDKTCIKNKHIEIIKSKKTTLIIRQFQDIYVDLWGPKNPSSISSINYMVVLLNEFTRKS